MKKYSSPICEFECLMTSDIITSSSSEFRVFSFLNVGDLDGERSIDVIEW